MRLNPATVRNIYIYDREGKCVAVEHRHLPSGVSSGACINHEEADFALRDNLQKFLDGLEQ